MPHAVPPLGWVVLHPANITILNTLKKPSVVSKDIWSSVMWSTVLKYTGPVATHPESKIIPSNGHGSFNKSPNWNWGWGPAGLEEGVLKGLNVK